MLRIAAACLWISGATPAQTAHEGPTGIIGPDGKVVAHCAAEALNEQSTPVAKGRQRRRDLSRKTISIVWCQASEAQ